MLLETSFSQLAGIYGMLLLDFSNFGHLFTGCILYRCICIMYFSVAQKLCCVCYFGSIVLLTTEFDLSLGYQ